MAKKPSDEKLRAQYQKTCHFIEGHLRRQGANAVGIQQTGKRIGWVQRHAAYRLEDYENFDQWREHKLRFSAEWTAKYLLIGASFNVEELQGKQLGVQALAAIARMPLEYRPTLLKYGQRHEATVIRAAFNRTKPFKDVNKGIAVLIEALSRPEGAENGKTRVSAANLPLPQQLQRCKRHLSTLITEIRSVRQRLAEGDSLPADERVALGTRLEVLLRELWDLSTAVTGRSPGEGFPTPDTQH